MFLNLWDFDGDSGSVKKWMHQLYPKIAMKTITTKALYYEGTDWNNFNSKTNDDKRLIIMCGRQNDWLDDDPDYVEVLQQQCRTLMTRGIPFFGICGGAQFLAWRFGKCVLEQLPAYISQTIHYDVPEPAQGLFSPIDASADHGYAITDRGLMWDAAVKVTHRYRVFDDVNPVAMYIGQKYPYAGCQFHPEWSSSPQVDNEVRKVIDYLLSKSEVMRSA